MIKLSYQPSSVPDHELPIIRLSLSSPEEKKKRKPATIPPPHPQPEPEVCNIVMASLEQGMYDAVKAVIEAKEGKIISLAYTKKSDKIKYRCENGHNVEGYYNHLMSGTWCRVCNGTCPKEAERHFREVVASKLGTVLGKYIKSTLTIRVRCELGHEFDAWTGHVIAGTWCIECNGRSPALAKQKFLDVVALKEGKVVSEYVDTSTHCELECKLGHRWRVQPSQITSAGTWCPACVGTCPIQARADFFAVVASMRGIVIGEYVNTTTNVEIQCGNFHRWSPRPSDIKKGKWCLWCLDMHPEQARERFFTAVENHGGQVTGTYVSARVPVEVKCEKGHIWTPTPVNVTSHGKWCGTCKQSHGEFLLLQYLNTLEGKTTTQFALPGHAKYRFDALYTPPNGTSYLLEYDGEQHFEDIEFFARRESLLSRQGRDRLKTQLAVESGYCIIRIDYTQQEVIPHHIQQAFTIDESVYLSSITMYEFITNPPTEVVVPPLPTALPSPPPSPPAEVIPPSQ